jgi:hypothetical protein
MTADSFVTIFTVGPLSNGVTPFERILNSIGEISEVGALMKRAGIGLTRIIKSNRAYLFLCKRITMV